MNCGVKKCGNMAVGLVALTGSISRTETYGFVCKKHMKSYRDISYDNDILWEFLGEKK